MEETDRQTEKQVSVSQLDTQTQSFPLRSEVILLHARHARRHHQEREGETDRERERILLSILTIKRKHKHWQHYSFSID